MFLFSSDNCAKKPKSLIDILNLIVTAIGIVVGIVGIYLAIHANAPIAQLITWTTGFLFVIALISTSLAFILLRRFMLHRRYTKAYIYFNAAFARSHRLRETQSDMQDLPKAIIGLQEFCTYLSQAFNCITSTECAVCIKLFGVSSSDDAFAKTFCRDSSSMLSSKRVKPADDGDENYIQANTDFKHIFDNIRKPGSESKYYFSNGLFLDDFYRNTRIDPAVYPPKTKIPIIKEIARYRIWPLPYQSTIVVPITPLTDQKIDENEIVGYLCIDSPKLWAFTSGYDINIMRGVADGLYPTMKAISEIHFHSVHKTVTQKPIKSNK